MVVALVALFIALSGGAYAGVTLNQVRSVHIKNGEVKTADLAASAVTSAKIKNNAVNSLKVAAGSLEASDLSAAAKATLKGNAGPAGATGPQGAQGVAGAQGAAGAQGVAGAAGTARAYAQTSGAAFVAARTKGFVGITQPNVGVYCLAPDPALGIDPLAVSVVASPEWGNSSFAAGAIVSARGAANSIPDACPAGNFAVRTMNSTGTLINGIAFMVIVP